MPRQATALERRFRAFSQWANALAMTSEGALATIAREPMQSRRILAVVILTACTAAEGFDIYAIAFAAPGIAQAWQIQETGLGIALAMDLVGMGLGAFLLGMVADRLGRRPIIICCLLIMASGMWLASIAPDLVLLSGARLYTGLGIGGLLATSSAIVAELSSDRARSLAITLLIGGFSLGAIVGGALVSALLAENDRWQTIFEVGALGTAVLVIPAMLLVPESPVFQPQGQPTDALSAGPLLAQAESGPAHRQLVLTLAFFMYMVSLYFLMKWIPKLVADMGYTPSTAGTVLVWAHVGGLAGTLAIGVGLRKWNLPRLVSAALLCGAVAVAAFGLVPTELGWLTVVASTAGFFIIGANSGFYSITAQSFPHRSRATRTGFVIGAGRAGSAAGPIAAGMLFQAGWALGPVSVAMALGCLIAALLLAGWKEPATQGKPTAAPPVSS